jgi:hypothetical protein
MASRWSGSASSIHRPADHADQALRGWAGGDRRAGGGRADGRRHPTRCARPGRGPRGQPRADLGARGLRGRDRAGAGRAVRRRRERRLGRRRRLRPAPRRGGLAPLGLAPRAGRHRLRLGRRPDQPGSTRAPSSPSAASSTSTRRSGCAVASASPASIAATTPNPTCAAWAPSGLAASTSCAAAAWPYPSSSRSPSRSTAASRSSASRPSSACPGTESVLALRSAGPGQPGSRYEPTRATRARTRSTKPARW